MLVGFTGIGLCTIPVLFDPRLRCFSECLMPNSEYSCLHSLEVMEKEAYEKADVLVVSDFIVASLPEQVSEKICAQRAKGHRFNSLVVDRTFMTQRLESLFDQEWVFDPVTSGVQELIGFQQRMSARPAQAYLD